MANKNVVEASFVNDANKVNKEDKFCPPIILSSEDVESNKLKDSDDFASKFFTPSSHHSFFTFLPDFVDHMMINMQQLRSTKNQLKILSVATGILTITIFVLTGLLIFSYLTPKDNSKNPVTSSPSTCDGLREQVQLQLTIIANLSAKVSANLRLPQRCHQSKVKTIRVDG